MARRVRGSFTIAKPIRRALPYSPLNVRIVRLALLYEDLRIEVYGIAERKKMRALDHLGTSYRRLYFVRRAVMTILEIKGAFQRLDECPEFQAVRKRFSQTESEAWREAVDFLIASKDRFKEVRDDVGGHFLERVADYALREISDRAVGLVTIRRGTNLTLRLRNSNS